MSRGDTLTGLWTASIESSMISAPRMDMVETQTTFVDAARPRAFST